MGAISISHACCKDGSLCSCWATNSALNVSAANRDIASYWLSRRKTTLHSKKGRTFSYRGYYKKITKSPRIILRKHSDEFLALSPQSCACWGCLVCLHREEFVELLIWQLFIMIWVSLRQGEWQHISSSLSSSISFFLPLLLLLYLNVPCILDMLKWGTQR